MSSAWSELLNKTTIAQFLSEKSTASSASSIALVQHTASLHTVLKLFQTNRYLSMPVMENESFVGFVELMDIVGYVLHSWKRASWRLDRDAFLQDKFFQEPIWKMLEVLKVTQFVPMLPKEATVADLVDVFTQRPPHVRIHRVAIGTTDKIDALITQRDLVNFFIKHQDAFPEKLLDQTVMELRLPRFPITAKYNDDVVSTLELLFENKVGGIGVVDEHNQLLASFSASEVRGMTPEKFEFFKGTTTDFLNSNKTFRMPITIEATATLRHTLEVMQKEKLHRIFLIDERQAMRGIITLTDLIGMFGSLPRETN